MGETGEGAPWAAFETFRGELLSEILSKPAVLPPTEAIDLVLQAASGLRAAHEVGLVHGNLSPDTILITRTADHRPVVKLIGFGLVQRGIAPSLRDAKSIQYAAPERLAGASPDERGDVFSLGAVLHQLLAGELPSAGGGGRVPVSEAVRRVLAKALERLPEDRFQTVAAFGRALATAMSRPPARIPSRARHAIRSGGILAVAVVLVVIAVLWLWRSTEESKLRLARDGAMAAGEPITTGELRDPPSAALDSTPMLLPESRPGGATAADSMLVDVRSVDPTIQVDLRYATADNFTGAPLPGYEAMHALLRRQAAAALGRVQARLRGKGLGLRVFDAYRPVRASRAMVDWAERTGRQGLLESGYIAERSRHNLGIAVDLTMVQRATGTEVPMGTTFDNFTAAARSGNASGEALRNRQILAEAMKSEGFRPHGGAWWHFNYPLEGAKPLDRVIR
jgi:D-alanyl-D-alanine dipeptidase